MQICMFLCALNHDTIAGLISELLCTVKITWSKQNANIYAFYIYFNVYIFLASPQAINAVKDCPESAKSVPGNGIITTLECLRQQSSLWSVKGSFCACSRGLSSNQWLRRVKGLIQKSNHRKCDPVPNTCVYTQITIKLGSSEKKTGSAPTQIFSEWEWEFK